MASLMGAIDGRLKAAEQAADDWVRASERFGFAYQTTKLEQPEVRYPSDTPRVNAALDDVTFTQGRLLRAADALGEYMGLKFKAAFIEGADVRSRAAVERGQEDAERRFRGFGVGADAACDVGEAA